MECWKQGCKNEVKVYFKWADPVSYSCEIHIYEHTQASFIKEDRYEILKLKVNQKNKELMIEELRKLSKELLDKKENLIKETYKKIEELKLSLIKALENIEKIRINQADLIRKLYSIKSIPALNLNPLEKLLSLDLDSARKQLDEFGCSFNPLNFDFENHEIVFFRTNTKSSVRVNLNNFSKFEQKIDILKSNVARSNCISMCLLPDKSIFCYGNYPATGRAFILYPDSTYKELSDGDPSAGMGAVYYDGFIYLFGGLNAEGSPWNQAVKYELSSNKWYKICCLNRDLCNVSCLAGNYGIIFVGFESSKLYSYNHNQDTHNKIYKNFVADNSKVLLQAENRIFLIESSKNIYESEPNQLNNWKIIGKFQINYNYRAAYQVYFNHNCFFMGKGCKIYKFDINTKQLTMTQV